ncbi:MAG: GntR family transcriptional regulator [Spirochaetota bacterium]
MILPTPQMRRIDKESYIPYYVQVKEALLEAMRNDRYTPGMALPSEQSLATEFDVTRATVRKALDELRREGVIKTERGKGSVVANSRIEQSLLQFYSFGREIGSTGRAATSRIIAIRQILAPTQVQKKLGLTGKGRTHEIIRLRYYKQQPLILEFSYVPEGIVPSISESDLEGQSLYDLLESKCNCSIERAKEFLYPRISDAYESEILRIPLHSPVFQTERITRSTEGEVIEFRRSVIRGDRVTFSTELS